MARKAILETGYVFTPGASGVGNIVIPKYIPREKLILITNVTSNTVIYNFTDNNLRATSYTATAPNYNEGVNINSVGVMTAGTPSTTVVLNYNTASMSSGDKIQIIIDEYEEKFTPAETFQDPVSKLRVSEPQALIDTDFEYSVQPTKWEALSLVQNYPSFYAKGSGATAIDITAINGGNQTPRSSMTITTSVTSTLAIGDAITVIDSTNVLANGTFIVDFVSGTTVVYTAKGQVNGSVLDSGYTTIYGGGIYPGSRIPLAVSASAMTYSGTLITVNTTAAHGLFPGTPIIIRNISATTNPPNGNWIISNVSTPTQFQFVAAATPTGTLASGTNFATSLLYTRPEGYQQHRSTDGGVLITSGGNFQGSQQIRQTRRYFRYQSGKGIQFSTGAKFTPTFDVSALTASGTTATVTTLQAHNLQVGATIKIEGVVSSAGDIDSNLYNITTTVSSVTGEKTFTYTLASTPTSLSPGGANIFVTCINWVGASVRTGLFDEQNGFFYEYDGQTLYACRRDSVKELFGTVAVTLDNQTVTGTGTKFRDQLICGDKIIIKGQSYEICQISSDTSLTISPSYRGPTRSGIKYLKTQTTRIPQSAWNIDRMNGTGSSGYNMDITNMQMAYIDYTWYGAGFIRFGFRAVNGEIIYCHKMPNNNLKKSAYMRSGNLPARFESINYGTYSRMVAGATATRGSTLASTDTTLYVENVSGWPTSGYIMIADGTNEELIQYSGIGSYNSTVRGFPLTGLTRRTTYSIAGVNPAGSFSSSAYTLSGTSSSVSFAPDTTVGGSGTPQIAVQYIGNTCAPVVSHWGVSVIMDGKYDDDKSIIFTAGMNRYSTCQAGVQRPLIAIRIAPSVDSGIGRNFGIREIINRMQLTLNGMGVYSQGQFLIEGILNPQTILSTGATPLATTDWQTISVGSGSLAQVYYFDNTSPYSATAATASGSFTGGDRIFGFYTENSGGTNFSATTVDLSKVRDLGTSILSGDGTVGNINPGFPVGPDILLISARLLEASGTKNIACRISWTEAQA
jgi:hypothetical protein